MITSLTFVMTGALMLSLLAGGTGAVPVEEWNRTFEENEARAVHQTSDGGYILAGNTWPHGDADIWLIKTDSSGNQLWNKTFGGTESETANSVEQTSDGGYILAGYTDSYGAGHWDFWLIKTDSSGNQLWNKTFGGKDQDITYSVQQQTSDGGYILAGYTDSYGAGSADAWLIKTDSSGNQLWNKTFGGTKFDGACSVEQTSDGGYILAGETESYGAGGRDSWLIKTDSSGNQLWNKTFGGTQEDGADSVQQTSDGGYILAGYTRSYGAGQQDIWLIKTDSSGNQLWNKTFGGTKLDGANSVQQTSDGGYILVGETYWNINGGAQEYSRLIKIREQGAIASALETTLPDINKPNEKSIPGFEILGAMFLVVILFLLMRKRT